MLSLESQERMAINRIAVAFVVGLCGAALLQPVSVTVHFKMYDALTHQPIRAPVQGQGPQ
jgi:hypothetical protein